jgi:hypothetical protein
MRHKTLLSQLKEIKILHFENYMVRVKFKDFENMSVLNVKYNRLPGWEFY